MCGAAANGARVIRFVVRNKIFRLLSSSVKEILYSLRLSAQLDKIRRVRIKLQRKWAGAVMPTTQRLLETYKSRDVKHFMHMHELGRTNFDVTPLLIRIVLFKRKIQRWISRLAAKKSAVQPRFAQHWTRRCVVDVTPQLATSAPRCTSSMLTELIWSE